MTYEDIVEAEKRRNVKASPADQEQEDAELEIRTSGLQGFCSVMQL